MNRTIISIGLVLLVGGGCATWPGTGPNTRPGTTTSTATTSDSPPKGTQYVTVRELGNQSLPERWPDDRTVSFANLSGPRQRTFLESLRNGTVTIPPDEGSPFSFYDERRPRFVRYEGTWYSVRVSIV